MRGLICYHFIVKNRNLRIFIEKLLPLMVTSCVKKGRTDVEILQNAERMFTMKKGAGVMMEEFVHTVD